MQQERSVCIIAEARVFGGTEAHTIGLIGTLRDRGYRIELISCGNHQYDQRLEANGWRDKVTILHTDLGVGFAEGSGAAAGIARWKKLLQSVASDTLFFPKSSSDMGGVNFLRLCRKRFARVFFIEHLEADPLPARSSRRLFGVVPLGVGLWRYRKRRVKQIRSSCADRLIAVSDKVKDRLTHDWGVDGEKIVVVRNGVRYQEFTRDEARGAAFRSRHDIPRNAFVFGMVSRLTDAKGIDIALRGLHRVVQKPPVVPVRLVIAGEGEDAEKLNQLTADLGLDEHVKFIGFVNDSSEALSCFDVILFSSRQEGLPLGLLEGMAAGCIPIVTRISGMPEAVNSPRIGWVVPPENPQELGDAMESVLKLDQRTTLQMRQDAVHRIQVAFDVAECHRKILEVCCL